MARFDVYEIEGAIPLVLDVQADLLSDLQTRVVIPLRPHSANQNPSPQRLEPTLSVADNSYVLMTADIGTVMLADLRGPVANLEPQRTAIINAIDFLLQGF